MYATYVYSDNLVLSGEIIALLEKMGRKTCAISINDADGNELLNYGAEKVYILEGKSQRPEDYSKAIAKLLLDKEAEAFLVGATVRGRDLAAQISAC